MGFKKIDHLGIAVKDLDESIALYTTLLGVEPGHIEEVADQKVKAAFFEVGDSGSNLELLAATSDESPIAKFLEKNRPGIHHLCVQVDDIEAEIKRLKNAGLKLIDESPRVGAHGKLVVFVHPKSTGGILLELSQDA